MAAFAIGCCLPPLLRHSLFGITLAQQCRSYALSRFPYRPIGFGRSSGSDRSSKPQLESPSVEHRSWNPPEHEKNATVDQSQLWGELRTRSAPTTDSDSNLKHLLLNNNELTVTRQLEMLNIFTGFEQSNRYVITTPDGKLLGYIAEEPRGFLSMFARQVFRTHRPFRALVMDLGGSPILWIRRPFSWINSRMFVQRPRDHLARTPEGDLDLHNFAEIQQEWHLWRRRYNLFLRCAPNQALGALNSEPNLAPTAPEVYFNQFARVDEGLWAWHFVLRDAQGEGLASVSRAFRGFGREIFTDSGQYTVSFRASDKPIYSSSQSGKVMLHKPVTVKNLTVDERALILAMAINVDYDYFSRHSEGGYGSGLWWGSGE